MGMKRISSTEAQNNFGRVIDDVTRNHTFYIVERWSLPQAVVVSFEDLAMLLEDGTARSQIADVVRESRPVYDLGRPLKSSVSE